MRHLQAATKLGNMNCELFDGCYEFVQVNETRSMTDHRFNDVRHDVDGHWSGVKSYDEAKQLLRDGYMPQVEELKAELEKLNGTVRERPRRVTDYVGYRPNVPAAIQGLPKSMYGIRQKPCRYKVINLVYDMTCSCGTSSENILQSGVKCISIVEKLEAKGFRINLYSAQSYYDGSGDVVMIKVKGASQPFNLKRMAFPLMHTAFFRVIGFDWYSRVPGGKYRSGYGHALRYSHSADKIEEMYSGLLREPCFCTNCVDLLKMSAEEFVEQHLKKLY